MKLAELLPDLPCAFPSLSNAFSEKHQQLITEIPDWTVAGTRKKLTAAFWLQNAIPHCASLLLLGVGCLLLFTKLPVISLTIAFFPFSFIIFLILIVTMYWPVYHLEFLPGLDVCIENFKRDGLEGIQRCKKEQYSVVSLMLIHYVFVELSGLKAPPMNTAGAELLSRQYGVSVKSVAPAQQLILRADWNRKSVRKRTEITDDFETAKEYFRQLNAEKAIKLLDKLQMKVLQ